MFGTISNDSIIVDIFNVDRVVTMMPRASQEIPTDERRAIAAGRANVAYALELRNQKAEFPHKDYDAALSTIKDPANHANLVAFARFLYASKSYSDGRKDAVRFGHGLAMLLSDEMRNEIYQQVARSN